MEVYLLCFKSSITEIYDFQNGLDKVLAGFLVPPHASEAALLCKAGGRSSRKAKVEAFSLEYRKALSRDPFSIYLEMKPNRTSLSMVPIIGMPKLVGSAQYGRNFAKS